jgi:radical SAM/Cys-rich protein
MIPQQVQSASPPDQFERRVSAVSPDAIRAERIETVMLNVGMRCDTTCGPCHHRCSPARTEEMTAETMAQALELVGAVSPLLLDITGGEPPLWPLLPDLLSRARNDGVPRIRVRTNLTGLLTPEASGVSQSLAEHRIEVLASLPAAVLGRDDPHLRALSLLRDLGYGDGRDGTVPLDIAHIPQVGRPVGPQVEVEDEFRAALAARGTAFRSLFEITGMPLGGLAAELSEGSIAADYLADLSARFNPSVVELLNCRHGIEVAWDGTLWDCDFNLAARTRLACEPRTVEAALADRAALATLASRRIAFGRHCFACTAGAGSS